MATYISLLNWTDEGIRTYKDTLDRASAAGDLAQKMGGTLKDVYWTTGPYDASRALVGAAAGDFDSARVVAVCWNCDGDPVAVGASGRSGKRRSR